MNAIVKIESLVVEFPSRETHQPVKRAVDGLNLEVHAGEVFGFLGPNGAGKTTTMNVLLGFVNASAGDAYLFGANVRDPIARKRIGYLPELTYYYKFLTAEEILRFYAGIFGIPKREIDSRVDAVLKLVELEHARKRLIKTYSKGMQQRVGLAQALINNPDLLILDEPTSGLDPIGRMKVREIIQRLKNGENDLLLLTRTRRSGNGLRPRGHSQPRTTPGRRPGQRADGETSNESRTALPENHRLSITAGIRFELI